MIKVKKKICIECKEEKKIWARKMCQRCDYLTKSKIPKTDKHKVKKKPLFSLEEDTQNKDTNKPSQYEMFLDIYNKSDKVSQISGKTLVGPEHKMFTWQFEHILPKGTYPDLKYNKDREGNPVDNIVLMTWQEHFDLTSNTAKCKEDSMYDEYFKIKEQAKENYYNDKRNKKEITN